MIYTDENGKKYEGLNDSSTLLAIVIVPVDNQATESKPRTKLRANTKPQRELADTEGLKEINETIGKGLPFSSKPDVHSK